MFRKSYLEVTRVSKSSEDLFKEAVFESSKNHILEQKLSYIWVCLTVKDDTSCLYCYG